KEFKETEEFLKEKKLPDKILQRHYDFVKQYNENYAKLKEGIEEAKKGKTKELKEFLEKAQYKEKPRPLDPNKLPHRLAPQIKPKEPRTKEAVSRKLSAVSTEDYLKETIDVQISDEIKKLAQETLKKNPVLLYEYVRNNFDYEPYYGSLKGSQQTLWEKAGNDFDLASLLIALYRAANIPARYVYGTIELPIEKAMNWVGVKDPYTAAQIFASGGIPSKAITSGGKIIAIRLEHIWVEVYIPYLPDEGISSRGQKMWIPLDVSFKQYQEKEGIDFEKELPFDSQSFIDQIKGSATINETEGYVTNVSSALINTELTEYQTRLEEYIKTNMPEATFGDLLGARMIKKEEFGILPCSLPNKTLLVQIRYSEIPNTLRHKVSFTIEGKTYTASTPELAGKRITLSYLYATPKDEATVERYGGIYNTPAYLVELKPLLTIEDEDKIEGNPAGLGLTQEFIMEFTEPNLGLTDRISNDLIVGAYYAITLNLQKIPSSLLKQRTAKLKEVVNLSETQPIERNKSIGELLYLTGLTYFAQLDIYNHIASQIYDTSYIRHPSEGITILGLNVSYLFSMPEKVSFAGMGIDVDRDVFSLASKTGDKEKEKKFMLSSGMTGSAMEHGIFELLYNTPGISAVKILQLASDNGIPVYSINKETINQILPKLQVSSSVKNDLQNAINTGKIVTIPQREIQYYDWEGIGYTIIDPNTGAGAYMISGGMAGGQGVNIIDWIKFGLERFLDYAKKELKISLAKIGSSIITIVKFVLEIIDILRDPNLKPGEKVEAIIIFTSFTILIGYLAGSLGFWGGLVFLVFVGLIIYGYAKLIDYARRSVGLSCMPSLYKLVWIIYYNKIQKQCFLFNIAD
ncbi:MAG: transglutaminase-like domain-containing protein, partial [bacterium]